MATFGVHSEVGKLRQVIVHRPDLSLQRLTPVTTTSCSSTTCCGSSAPSWSTTSSWPACENAERRFSTSSSC